MSKRTKRTEPKALALVERAVHLLRRNNWAALAEYYLGSLPFMLALLYFCSDMSGNPMAAWYCGPTAAGVALLFIWMKLWQVRFCRRLWSRLQDSEPERWTWMRTFETAARQAVLHATGVIALPIALIVLLPFGWVYAFYQNLCALDSGQDRGMKALVKAAKEQAALWPGQNHIVLFVMNLFGILVFFNLAVGLVWLPYLLKSIFGIETVFTLSGVRLFNTTFFAILTGLTYLCIDPLLKTFYVLRCFYGSSRRTGDDLKAALRPFLKAGAATLMIFIVALPCAMGWADQQAMKRTGLLEANEKRYATRLDRQIESVLEQRRFAWRLPREEVPVPPEEHGWISSTIDWIGEKISALFKIIGGWIEAFIDWMVKKLPAPKFSPSDGSADYRGVIRWIFYALGFGLALGLLYWMVRWLRQSKPMRRIGSDGDADAVDIDLSDENITAEDLPLDRWLAMAQEMVDRKDFRRALRAMYLSVLAQLADHQRVKIARYKSNRDYADELARRAHAEPELLKVFDWCIGVFERSWYGMHPVDRKRLDQFMDHQKRIAALVQPAA